MECRVEVGDVDSFGELIGDGIDDGKGGGVVPID
jgi:hypothetical protein